MSQHTKDNQDSEIDSRIDSLLSRKIEPSRDFTARVLSEIQDQKVIRSPWLNKSNWAGAIIAAAAAILFSFGINTSSSSSVTADPSNPTVERANPFLSDVLETDLLEETPFSTVDFIFDSSESLEGLDALLDEPELIDLYLLIES